MPKEEEDRPGGGNRELVLSTPASWSDGARSVNRIAPSPEEGQGTTGFARRVVVAVLITLVILAVGYFLWRGADILLEAFAGVLVAVFLASLTDWLSRQTRLSYGWSLAVVVLGLSLIAGVLGYFLCHLLSV